ncbi:MAG TPA: peptidoglycan-binding domain-containing protein [Gaiellaceae bacterium]|jgi:hypothetical protein|nr:peptidoglycan-binding domain-containing protein [Gaiellaceae bacterium]
MDRATYWDKANSAAEAWRARYGTDPAAHQHAIELVMAVAMHETVIGEAWNRSGNWGAIQRRAMTTDERAVAAGGGKPTPRDPFEQLEGDSSPIHGRYQTWFWAFPAGVPTAKGQTGDVAGADKLLEVLLDERALIKARIDLMTIEELAEHMYASGYYEGVHDPRVSGGKEANVADYVRGLNGAWGPIASALVGWTPGADPTEVAVTEPAGPPDPSTPDGLQAALNSLGAAPPLKVDGVVGPKTKAAVAAFQTAHGLVADGIAGPGTVAAIRAALG